MVNNDLNDKKDRPRIGLGIEKDRVTVPTLESNKDKIINISVNLGRPPRPVFVMKKGINIEDKLLDIEKTLGKIEERLSKLENLVEDSKTTQEKLASQAREIAATLGRLERWLAGLSESILSWLFIQSLERDGYNIIYYERNTRIGGDETALLVVASRNGERKVFLVETSVKPTIRDLGGLLALVDLYESRTSQTPIPVMVGVYVDDEVEKYAREKGIQVYKV